MDQAMLETAVLAEHGTEQENMTLTTLLPRVSVIVPALNEAENIPHVLPRIPVGHEVILVDGGSTDGTVAAALACRPNVRIVTQERRGKGDALASGFAAATGDIIVTLDADGSQRPEEIERFVNALCDGADFVKGSRVTEGGGSTDFTWLRKAGNGFLGAAANVLFGSRYTDITYGYNAFWSAHTSQISGGGDGFEGELLMPIRAVQSDLNVAEVPCQEDERMFGESRLRPFRDGTRILKMFLAERMRRGRRISIAQPDELRHAELTLHAELI
jgi:glycosyltransferase involved in cell wall biosynthesis